MEECYLIPDVNSLINSFSSSKNTTIGVFIKNFSFDSLSKMEEYFYLYSPNVLKGQKLTTEDLNDFETNFYPTFCKSLNTDISFKEYLQSYGDKHIENWSEIKNNILNEFGSLIFEAPILIERYSPQKDVKTIVALIKMKVGKDDLMLLTNFNLIKVKNRLIMFAYYRKFDKVSLLNEIKTKNNQIISIFMQANK
jgi:hypothetical protein